MSDRDGDEGEVRRKVRKKRGEEQTVKSGEKGADAPGNDSSEQRRSRLSSEGKKKNRAIGESAAVKNRDTERHVSL